MSLIYLLYPQPNNQWPIVIWQGQISNHSSYQNECHWMKIRSLVEFRFLSSEWICLNAILSKAKFVFACTLFEITICLVVLETLTTRKLCPPLKNLIRPRVPVSMFCPWEFHSGLSLRGENPMICCCRCNVSLWSRVLWSGLLSPSLSVTASVLDVVREFK